MSKKLMIPMLKTVIQLLEDINSMDDVNELLIRFKALKERFEKEDE